MREFLAGALITVVAVVLIMFGMLLGHVTQPDDPVNCQEDEVAVHTPYYTPGGELQCVNLEELLPTSSWQAPPIEESDGR